MASEVGSCSTALSQDVVYRQFIAGSCTEKERQLPRTNGCSKPSGIFFQCFSCRSPALPQSVVPSSESPDVSVTKNTLMLVPESQIGDEPMPPDFSHAKMQNPPCCHSGHEWRHEWQHGGFCPFRRSFGCVLLLNQIFIKQCTVRQYTTLIYLINLLWKLVLGLELDSGLHYFSIFTENKKNEHLIFCECHGR